jgi:hypothetical protein
MVPLCEPLARPFRSGTGRKYGHPALVGAALPRIVGPRANFFCVPALLTPSPIRANGTEFVHGRIGFVASSPGVLAERSLARVLPDFSRGAR